MTTMTPRRPPADLNADELLAEARACLDAIEAEDHPLSAERAARRLCALARQIQATFSAG